MKKENTVTWQDILTDYRIYLGLNVVLLLVIVFLLVSGRDKEPRLETDLSSQEEIQNGSPEDAAEAEAEPEPENRLEVNTHASIDRLFEKYCACIASGDVEGLEAIVDYLSEEEKKTVRNRAKLIISCDNIVCYTKNGPVEDSYIVFVTYDMKLKDVETSAPDIRCLYVGPNGEEGRRIINNVDEDVQAYVTQLEQDPEVQALYSDVTARYQAAAESDKSLAEFIQKISGQVAEEPQPPEEEPETPEEEPQPEEPAANTSTAQNRQTRVTSTVNVRSETSTESARLAVAYQGDTIMQIESYDNGWSKVEYNGQTGYVMTEYLE